MAAFIPAGVALGGKLLGGLFGKKKEEKQAEAARESNAAALKLKQQMGEDTRLGHLDLGQSVAPQLAAKGFVMPSGDVLSKLGARRNYDELINKAGGPGGAGAGSAFLQGVFGDVADVAGQYDYNQGLSQPAAPTLEQQSGISITPFDPELERTITAPKLY